MRLTNFLADTGAVKSATGEQLVKLGEVYYGFSEFEHAIASIQLGIARGGIKHLDEAYVYLGRAEEALGDLDAARAAFDSLKDVPGISPRVLRLWMLYAETRLTSNSVHATANSSMCPTPASEQ